MHNKYNLKKIIDDFLIKKEGKKILKDRVHLVATVLDCDMSIFD